MSLLLSASPWTEHSGIGGSVGGGSSSSGNSILTAKQLGKASRTIGPGFPMPARLTNASLFKDPTPLQHPPVQPVPELTLPAKKGSEKFATLLSKMTTQGNDSDNDEDVVGNESDDNENARTQKKKSLAAASSSSSSNHLLDNIRKLGGLGSTSPPSSLLPPPSSQQPQQQQQQPTVTSFSSSPNLQPVPHEGFSNYHDCYTPNSTVLIGGTSGRNRGSSSGGSNVSFSQIRHDDEIEEKLDYLIHLLQEQRAERTQYVTEEFLLYTFLGVFIIYVTDGFARAGRYIR